MVKIRKTAPTGNEQKELEKKLVRLYDAFLTLKTKEDCAKFFRDLFTLSELQAMAERFAIAELAAKDVSYRTISGTVPSSIATVTRVAHWLHHGTGGYRTVISRMQKHKV